MRILIIDDDYGITRALKETLSAEYDVMIAYNGFGGLQLAEENDFTDRFEGCQTGAEPPFGDLFGMDTYVETDLAEEEYIAFNTGSHTEVIAMRFSDYRRLAHPKLAHISTMRNRDAIRCMQI